MFGLSAVQLVLIIALPTVISAKCFTVKDPKDSFNVCDPTNVNVSNPDIHETIATNATWLMIVPENPNKIITLFSTYENWNSTHGLNLRIYDEAGTDYSNNHYPNITYWSSTSRLGLHSYIFAEPAAPAPLFLRIWADQPIGVISGTLYYGDKYDVPESSFSSINQTWRENGDYTFFRFALHKNGESNPQDFVTYLQSVLHCSNASQNLQTIFVGTCHEGEQCAYPMMSHPLATTSAKQSNGLLEIGFPNVTLANKHLKDKQPATYLLATIVKSYPGSYCTTNIRAYVSPYVLYDLDNIHASETFYVSTVRPLQYTPIRVKVANPTKDFNVTVQFASDESNLQSLFHLFYNRIPNITFQNQIQADYSQSQSGPTNDFETSLNCSAGTLYFSIYNTGHGEGAFSLRVSAGKSSFWYIVFGVVTGGLLLIFAVIVGCSCRKTPQSHYTVIE